MTALINKINRNSDVSLASLSIASLLVLEVISIFSWRWPVLGSVVTAILVLGWVALSLRSLPLAVAWLIVELIVGSFGYLLSFNIGNTDLSLRLCLFLAAFAVMVYKIASNRQHIIFRHRWSWWYAGALFALIWAAARGYYNWNSLANLFLDLNGYLYILLLPLILEAYEEVNKEKILRYVKIILVPAVIWLSFRTIWLLYMFTHIEAELLVWLYKWYRDSGLGEITPAGGGFWRVFSQSHLYASLASVVGFAWLWQRLSRADKIKINEPVFLMVLVALVALVASLSRSLWLGATVAWLLVPLVNLSRENFRYLGRYLLFTIILISAAAGTVLTTARLNWPLPALTTPSAQAFANRFGVEAAGQARINLWPPLWQAVQTSPLLGSGLGSMVAYYSTDPRAVQTTAGGSGLVVTYAFEWGWLDLWYKFGLIGMIFWTAWLVVPVWQGYLLWRKGHWFGFTSLALTALYLTHFTTPYLNHPLGLGVVMVLGGLTLTRGITE